MEPFSERLKKALTIRNMRQVELAEKTGIGKSAISQYVSGSFKPRQDNTSAIALALDVSEAWLMGFDVPMELTPNSTSLDIGNRIRILREDLNLTQEEVGKRIGVTEATVNRYETGEIDIKRTIAIKLATVLNTTPSYIMGWDNQKEYDFPFPEPKITDKYTTFPVIGEIAAGYDNIADESWDGEVVEIPDEYLQGRSVSDFFVLRVKGDSMYPLYHDGDKVLILRQSTLNASGDIGAVIYDDDIGTLKKVEFVKGEDWMRLVPINPNIPPIMIEGERLEHCRVVGIPKLLIREIQ